MVVRCPHCGAPQPSLPDAYCIECREPLELEAAERESAADGNRAAAIAQRGRPRF